MIPLSKDKPFLWTDSDDGAVFEIAPAIGDNELLLYGAFEKIAVDPVPFLPEAQKIIDATSNGKRWKAGERLKAITAKAGELAGNSKSKSRFSKDELSAAYRAIDTFILSCTPKGEEKIVFDSDASQRFKIAQNMKLLNAITEVNNLTGEDKKN